MLAFYFQAHGKSVVLGVRLQCVVRSQNTPLPTRCTYKASPAAVCHHRQLNMFALDTLWFLPISQITTFLFSLSALCSSSAVDICWIISQPGQCFREHRSLFYKRTKPVYIFWTRNLKNLFMTGYDKVTKEGFILAAQIPLSISGWMHECRPL